MAAEIFDLTVPSVSANGFRFLTDDFGLILVAENANGFGIGDFNNSTAGWLSAPNDVCIQANQIVLPVTDGHNDYIAFLIRESGSHTDVNGEQNGYGIYANGLLGTLLITKRHGSGGGYAETRLNNGTYTAIAAGQTMIVKAQVVGSTISVKVWQQGNSEPGSWTLTATDSTFTSGDVGIIPGYTNSSTWVGNPPIINTFYIGDPGSEFPGPTTGTIAGSTTGTIGTTETYTLTTDRAWTGTPTLTITGSASGTITQFSAFSNATTGTATVAWTGAGTATVNATFSDSLGVGSPVTTAVADRTVRVTQLVVEVLYLVPPPGGGGGGGGDEMGTLKLQPVTPPTPLASSGSLGNGSVVVAGQFDNTTAGSVFADFGLAAVFGSGPTVADGCVVKLYLVPYVNSTNADTVDDTTPVFPTGTFVGNFKPTTTGTTVYLSVSGATLSALKYDVYLFNQTGQSISSWTLTINPTDWLY